MRNQHVWRETTAAGEKREVRAVKFAGRWKLQSRLGADAWTYHDKPSLSDLEALRDLIWRKYQRKRASYDDVTSIDRLLEESGAAGGKISDATGRVQSNANVDEGKSQFDERIS